MSALTKSRLKQEKRRKFEHAFGLDWGTGNIAMLLFDGFRYLPVETTANGLQTPSVLYRDPETSSCYFGSEALTRCIGNDPANLITHAKRQFASNATEKVFANGSLSAYDALVEFLRFIRDAAANSFPVLLEYPQFGGSQRQANALCLAAGVPGSWPADEQALFREAAASVFGHIDGLVPEPVAAARRIAHQAGVTLQDGDTILPIDLGAGTSDFAFLEYDKAVFHQRKSIAGAATLAGNEFTAVIARAIAEHFGVPWEGAYHEGGLNLSAVAEEVREHVLASWQGAELGKHKLELLDEAIVPLWFPDGKKSYTLTRSEVLSLSKEPIERFRTCLQQTVTELDCDISTVTHIMLAGGGSKLFFIANIVEEELGRRPILSKDSQLLVAQGVAEQAFFGERATQILPSGLGIVTLDRDTEQTKNLQLLSTGHVVDVDGTHVSKSNFLIDTRNGETALKCVYYGCKRSVQAIVDEGHDTILEDSQIVEYQPVYERLDLPPGDHRATIAVECDHLLNVALIVQFDDLPNVEPLRIPLTMRSGAVESPPSSLAVAFVIDLSRSNERYGKFEMIVRGTHRNGNQTRC